jgi:hypothetical protein
MGTEAYTRGIHMPIIYGDFFLAEAMLKLKGNDFLQAQGISLKNVKVFVKLSR